MDDNKMFKISCILFLWGCISAVIGIVGMIGLSVYELPLRLIVNIIWPFMLAGFPWGWRKTKNWKLPFTFIGGPIEIAVLLLLRLFLCAFVGAPVFVSMAIKHFTGGSKKE